MHGLRSKFAVIAGVIRVTSKTFEDAVGFPMIQEAQSVLIENDSVVKTEHAFPVRGSERGKLFHLYGKKGHIKRTCFTNLKNGSYRGGNKSLENYIDQLERSMVTFIAKAAVSSTTTTEKWHIDSGAWDRMFNYESSLAKLKKKKIDRPVSIEDGSNSR